MIVMVVWYVHSGLLFYLAVSVYNLFKLSGVSLNTHLMFSDIYNLF